MKVYMVLHVATRSVMYISTYVQAAMSATTVAGAPPAALAATTGNGWYSVADATEAKTVFITGANSGIGFAAAGKLAAAGHDVVLACRTQSKAERACAAIQVCC
jgi:NADPH:quinone reductase-like Zn-dependent oxidoreductase